MYKEYTSQMLFLPLSGANKKCYLSMLFNCYRLKLHTQIAHMLSITYSEKKIKYFDTAFFCNII